MARPAGSQNKDKPFRDALRMQLAAAGDDHKALRGIADALITSAQSGDIQAIKEIGDRLDGKPAQSIDLDASVTTMTHEQWLDSLTDTAGETPASGE